MRKQFRKKLIASTLVIILALVTITTTTLSFAASNSFSDIGSHWANKNIMSLQNKKVINGYPDGTFKPDGSMTRAEFITVMLRSLGIQKAETEGKWYAGYLAKANQYNYIQDNNNIINEKPDNPITRLEATTTLANLIDIVYAST